MTKPESEMCEAFYWCRRRLEGGSLGPVFLGAWVNGRGFAEQYSDFEKGRFLTLEQVDLVDGEPRDPSEAPLTRPEVGE